MRQLRIYWLSRSGSGDWSVGVFRDLDEVLAAWETVKETPKCTGVVHVGTTRIASTEFSDIAERFPQMVLLTSSARWAFDDSGSYSQPVGFVGAMSIHVAVEGWGYEARLTDIPISLATTSQMRTPLPWLAELSAHNPGLAQTLTTAGIRDEESYEQVEPGLPWQVRQASGRERARFLLGNRDIEDPIAVVHASPRWLLQTEITKLRIPVRCKNALIAASVHWVQDLIPWSPRDLRHLPAFGAKSQRDLAKGLWQTITEGPPREMADLAARAIISPAGIVRRSESLPESIGSFKLAFQENMQRLKDSQREVLTSRFGARGDRMTLEEVARRMGITRERVRQIETQAIREFLLDSVWERLFAPKVLRLLDEREDPLPVSGLAILDPWFMDIDDMMPQFIFAIDKLVDRRLDIIEIDGIGYISELSETDWRIAVRSAVVILENAVPHNADRQTLREQIETLLPGKGRELASELWAAVVRLALFAPDSDGVERLQAVGRSGDKLVAALLQSSPRPIHFSEIPSKVEESFGRSIELRRAHAAARSVGMLFGRGMFGMMRHCPISPQEMAEIRDEVEEIIQAGPVDRQWSCDELIEILAGQDSILIEKIDRYVLDIALRGSKVLNNLGRFVWVRASDRRQGTSDRLLFNQAIESVLQAAGHPLTSELIKLELQRSRGLSGYFQIHSKGRLIRISRDLWGLLDRDVAMTAFELNEMRNAFAARLRNLERGIHLDELLSELQHCYPKSATNIDPQGATALLTRDSRFRISGSGYVYLSDWGEPRRLSRNEAVSAVMKGHDRSSLSVAQIAEEASLILGRTLDRASVHAGLRECGARFEESSATWSLPSHEDEAVEE